MVEAESAQMSQHQAHEKELKAQELTNQLEKERREHEFKVHEMRLKQLEMEKEIEAMRLASAEKGDKDLIDLVDKIKDW